MTEDTLVMCVNALWLLLPIVVGLYITWIKPAKKHPHVKPHTPARSTPPRIPTPTPSVPKQITTNKPFRGYTVYWLHLEGMFTAEGYIGVSNNLERRLQQHREMLLEGKHHSKTLQTAYAFRGNREFKYSVIRSNLTKKQAYDLEHSLRPKPCMGWNRAQGGINGVHFKYKHKEPK